MAISNNSSVIRTFDIGTRSEPCWVLDRCPRLLDQQTVAEPWVPCRLLITYFFIFNQKVHVFYCSWYNFAAHLSRPRGSGDAPCPCSPISHSQQPSCSASALTEGQGRAFRPRVYSVLFLTVLVASRILISDSEIWIWAKILQTHWALPLDLLEGAVCAEVASFRRKWQLFYIGIRIKNNQRLRIRTFKNDIKIVMTSLITVTALYHKYPRIAHMKLSLKISLVFFLMWCFSFRTEGWGTFLGEGCNGSIITQGWNFSLYGRQNDELAKRKSTTTWEIGSWFLFKKPHQWVLFISSLQLTVVRLSPSRASSALWLTTRFRE